MASRVPGREDELHIVAAVRQLPGPLALQLHLALAAHAEHRPHHSAGLQINDCCKQTSLQATMMTCTKKCINQVAPKNSLYPGYKVKHIGT